MPRFKKLVASARANGLFVLAGNGRLEFLSATSGKPVLFYSRGRYWTPGSDGERGLAGSAFKAMQMAIDLDRRRT
jgi:hypothetical protein